jgi:hypothetical protein
MEIKLPQIDSNVVTQVNGNTDNSISLVKQYDIELTSDDRQRHSHDFRRH